LHGSILHLLGNTLVFVPLGWLVLLRGETDFWIVTLVSAIAGGYGVWLLGRSDTTHIGASGVIFGYLGFLLFGGFFERNWFSLILSLAAGVFYWHLLPGLLPTQRSISWESHLFGFLGGILAA
jgi:membrane associated rhomboid family serine protease